ncbi:uncharacterized protein F5Z01DRAFT_639703 [Emericellopsis atlantica]|uniref:Uncharacterized protein n=1 Tax=Emericellopsis atlantica TaxID=2614577 RepID=A0A9P8CKX5_9HYPO|nr:uncharacterized protein F5Z01DRAFT_639703 [Emericellopsis atlantica]KAG9251039.1 hypothetical protein F5Z01DRAFT_639703 [Emericellopsis atlantica]
MSTSPFGFQFNPPSGPGCSGQGGQGGRGGRGGIAKPNARLHQCSKCGGRDHLFQHCPRRGVTPGYTQGKIHDLVGQGLFPTGQTTNAPSVVQQPPQPAAGINAPHDGKTVAEAVAVVKQEMGAKMEASEARMEPKMTALQAELTAATQESRRVAQAQAQAQAEAENARQHERLLALEWDVMRLMGLVYYDRNRLEESGAFTARADIQTIRDDATNTVREMSDWIAKTQREFEDVCRQFKALERRMEALEARLRAPEPELGFSMFDFS